MTENRLRLLVPLDGSPEAESILPALIPLFRSRRVRPTLFGVTGKDASTADLEAYFHRLRTSLLLDGVAAESKVEWGDAAGEILWFASSNHVDLIAMTTHGRSGLSRAVAGSVAENVIRRAHVPVVACRPGTRVGNWNKLLVALDGSSASEAVLADALEFARATGATVHLIRVKSLLPILATHHGVPLEIPEVDPRPYLEGVADRLATQGVLSLPEVRSGDEAAEIAACAQDIGAGMIFMTTHGRTGLSRLFLGSVAERVLRTAPCPVLFRRSATTASALGL